MPFNWLLRSNNDLNWLTSLPGRANYYHVLIQNMKKKLKKIQTGISHTVKSAYTTVLKLHNTKIYFNIIGRTHIS